MDATELDITTADGVAHAWMYPGGSGAAVLMYADAFGVRPTLHAMAARLAALGYAVLLPNLFYREGAFAPFDEKTAFSVPAERDRLMALIQSVSPDRLAIDGAAYLDALVEQPGVRPDRVGVTGYCMGGRCAYLTAAQHPDRVRAVAAFHAGRLVTDAPDSPHRLADRVKASLYLGVADQDAGCTPDQQGVLASALAAAGLQYTIELYRGKKHGFAVSDSAVYDQEAAARHWRRMESFFLESLC